MRLSSLPEESMVEPETPTPPLPRKRGRESRLPLFLLLLLFPGVARAETIVLEHATVLPQDSAAIEDGDVTIADGRITAVGRHGAAPAGARVIDATGGFLVPGLIDVHVHVTDESLFSELFITHGVTTVRDLGNRLEAVTAFRDHVLLGKRLGPEVVFVGPILDGPNPTWPLISQVVETPAAVPPLLASLKAAGVQSFKVYESLAPEVYEAILVEARKLGVPVVGHVPSRVGVRRCIEAGQDTIEHLDHFQRALVAGEDHATGFLDELAGWIDLDEAKEKALIAALLEHRTKLDPTRVVVRNYSLLARGKTPDVPAARYVPRDIREALWSSAPAAKADAATDERHERSLARALAFVKKAHDAGVPILVGSDTPNPYVVPGASVHDEIEELAKVLGPAAALEAATLSNARALGRADLGRIAVGARADLVLLAKDPREDPRAVRAIRAVIVRGTVLDRADLDARLAVLEAKAKKSDVPIAGFEAIAGDLAPGKTPLAPELRLEGRVAPYPPSFWSRSGSFAYEGGGTFRALRSAGSAPFPFRADETLVTDARGELLRYHVAHTAMGDMREATVTRGEKTTRIGLFRDGSIVSEIEVPVGTELSTEGELLVFDLIARRRPPVGETSTLRTRSLDLDRMVVGEPVETTIAHPDARTFVVAAAGEKIRISVDERGEPTGFVLEAAFGTFTVAKPVAARKKYY
jgi:imidazolonepropionase-like amidohydrolase